MAVSVAGSAAKRVEQYGHAGMQMYVQCEILFTASVFHVAWDQVLKGVTFFCSRPWSCTI